MVRATVELLLAVLLVLSFPSEVFALAGANQINFGPSLKKSSSNQLILDPAYANVFTAAQEMPGLVLTPGSEPAGVTGKVYYKTASSTLWFYNGTVWTELASGGGSGDITAVIAGSGLTGGATSGDATLDIGAGTGITVSDDAIAINQAASLTWTGTETFNTNTVTFGVAPTFGTMTAGSVFFAGAAGVLTQDSTNFFWDDANNRLGILNAAPVAPLHIGSVGVRQNTELEGIYQDSPTAGQDDVVLSRATATAADGPSLEFIRGRGTHAAFTTVSAGDTLGTLFWGGYNNAKRIQVAGIRAKSATGVGNGADFPTTLSFYTTADGSASATENLRLNADGSSDLVGNLKIQGALGSGSEVLTDVTAADASVTVASATNARSVKVNMANANTWTGAQTFNTNAPTFGTMTAGSVFFAGTAGVLTEDNSNLFWNDTNNRLGIGTSSPARSLHVANGHILLENNNFLQIKDSGGTIRNILTLTNDTNNITRFVAGNNTGGFQWGNQAQSAAWLGLSATALSFGSGCVVQATEGAVVGTRLGLPISAAVPSNAGDIKIDSSTGLDKLSFKNNAGTVRLAQDTAHAGDCQNLYLKAGATSSNSKVVLVSSKGPSVALIAYSSPITNSALIVRPSSDITLDYSVNGAVNKLDTGTISGHNWYYSYLIYNSSSGAIGMLGSASAPNASGYYGGSNMPAGYDYSACINVVRHDNSGSAYIQPFTTVDKYTEIPQFNLDATTIQGGEWIVTGGRATTLTEIGGSSGKYVPSNTSRINMLVLYSFPSSAGNQRAFFSSDGVTSSRFDFMPEAGTSGSPGGFTTIQNLSTTGTFWYASSTGTASYGVNAMLQGVWIN